MTCDYCKRERPLSEMTRRGDVWMCCDGTACENAEQAAWDARLVELRALRRAGEELTDAERGELADG